MAEGGADPPDIGDEAVLIPCEFCCLLFPISEIIQHQSGCDGNLENFSKPKIHETLLESSQTPTRQESEHRNKNSEIPPEPTFKIEQLVTHDTFDIRKIGDGYVLKKVSKQGDEKEAAEKIDGSDELNDISKQKESDKIQQSSKKIDGRDELNDIPKQKEDEKIQQNSNKDDGGGKSENIPKSKESDRINQSGKKDDGDESVRKVSFDTKRKSPKPEKPNSNGHNKTANRKDDGDEFVRKESFGTKGESPKAHKPNSNVHNKVANRKSSAYGDDFSDSSDDNNPENETVEHFIRKALAQAESRKKTFHKSEELEA